MLIDVAENLNCRENVQFVFNPLGEPRPVRALRIWENGIESLCPLTGVGEGGLFIPAHAVKVNDSAAGHAYLIYGGEWGIRFKRAEYAEEPWDLTSSHQWGEPFKLYGEEKDILF